MSLPIVHQTLTVIQHLMTDNSAIHDQLDWICPKQLQENEVFIEAPFLTDVVWIKCYEKELIKCYEKLKTL